MQGGGKVALKLLSMDWETKAKESPARQKQLGKAHSNVLTTSEAEIKILRETNHPNVVRLLDLDKHPVTGQLCLVMVSNLFSQAKCVGILLRR